MKDAIEEIKVQLHDLRNLLSPVEILLTNFEERIKENEAEQKRKLSTLETKIDELSKQIDLFQKKASEIAPIVPRLRRHHRRVPV